MRARLGRQVGLAVWIAIGTAVLALASLWITIVSLEAATQSARVHERVATRAQRVGALVIDAETAVRGFALTRQERFLEPLEIAQREMPAVSGQLLSDARSDQERRLADQLTTIASAYFVDFALPTVEQARRDPGSARMQINSEAGKRRVDAIRLQVATLVRIADDAAQDQQEAASRRASTARIVAITAALLIAFVLLLLQRRLQRRVVRPVLLASAAAERIGAGDFAARLPEMSSHGEVGQLSRALNQMAVQLQETADELDAQHTELESQNAELEAQSVELETQAEELERRGETLTLRNEELRARTRELEATGARLQESSERVRRYANVAERLAQVPDAASRAERLLDELADALEVPLGAIYLRHSEQDAALRLVASRGLGALPEELDAEQQLAGRALRERRMVTAAHADATLEVRTLGGRAVVRHELHVPLLVGADRDTVLGVISLARTDDRPFTTPERELVDHLALSSALALLNALVSSQRREQAAMLRAVLASVTEAIVVVDTEQEIVLSNPAMDAFAARLLGTEPGEPWAAAELRAAIDHEVPDPVGRAAETEYFDATPLAVDHADLEFPRLGLWLHRYVAPVFGVDDQLLGRIVVMRDITEERKAERAKDDLMATVSHELRTPLAAILGFAELLVAREFPEDERREYLETVHQQSLRLSGLLDDFLDLQRLERRGLGTVVAVDLRDVIEEQARLYAAQSARHEVEARPVEEPLLVDADAERVRRVLGNLLSNAIKYSPAGGPVRVEALRENGVVRVAVVDRGIGIPATLRERVFERFFRIDSPATARIGGTGLGLSLVRDIVHAHGGTVGVESVEGEGSRFWFTLPAQESGPGMGAPNGWGESD